LTALLENNFETKIISHRAGRWAMNETYMILLEKYGYKVDCSVTPGISWVSSPSIPNGRGGSGYTKFPNYPYYPSYRDIGKEGNMKVLELPVTILKNPVFNNTICGLFNKMPELIKKTKFLNALIARQHLWIRPRGNNLIKMIKTADSSIKTKEDNANYIQFMLHSSEMTAGTNPKFKDEDDIDKLYKDMEILFKHLSKKCVGMTLGEYQQLHNCEKI